MCSEDEESIVMFEVGFNFVENWVIGNVLGELFFKGVLVYCGWWVVKVDLFKLVSGYDVWVIVLVEVELWVGVVVLVLELIWELLIVLYFMWICKVIMMSWCMRFFWFFS